ncbi:MAG TPA: metallophosphoesterase [Candidatus Deferrimicrobium sp.]|nr:metallophosphoesterase [Candidatus Deferrimicrobium sp.]
MPDIRYVCLSDMHLGEEGSLLTNLKDCSAEVDPLKPSPVMRQLVKCLETLTRQNEGQEDRPTLILNGDILELALADTNEAAMCFERFIELIPIIEDRPLFDRIIYIPGNHDHHLWEVARETQYVEYLKRKTQEGAAEQFLKPPWHTTKLFENPHVNAYFLNCLIQRSEHLKDLEVTTAYPSFGLPEENRQRCVIFHHGHFVESMYYLMSKLRSLVFPGRGMPDKVNELEAENFAWIDFFWSTLGRSGQVGRDVEVVYEKLQDDRERKQLLSSLAWGLAKRYGLPAWGNWLEAGFLKMLFRCISHRASPLERGQADEEMSEGLRKGLTTYVEGPLRKQIRCENECVVPDDVTIVFGHTHKPFEEIINFEGYHHGVKVYNSGGWVVDQREAQETHGGAVILIDEDLNVTSLRMYNESDKPEKYAVRVEEASHNGGAQNPLYQRLSKLVDPSAEPWKTFSKTAASEVQIRMQNLLADVHGGK